MTTISEAENIQCSYHIIFIRRIAFIRFLHRRNCSRDTKNVIALCERTLYKFNALSMRYLSLNLTFELEYRQLI